MLANLLNTLVGLVLVYSAVLERAWVQHRFFPLLVFAALIFVLALWARFNDPMRWFSWVNIVLAIALAILALLPLATMPLLAFWGTFWVGCLVPVVALWAALCQRDIRKARAAEAAVPAQ